MSGRATYSSSTEVISPNTLCDYGYNQFDAWAGQFGQVVNSLELQPSGKGVRSKLRFAKFDNLPELYNLFQLIGDVITNEMISDYIKLPELEGGKPTIVSAPPSPAQKAYTDILVQRAKKYRNGLVNKRDDNMLLITNDGRKAGLDMRVVDPAYADFPDSKVNKCIANVYDIWHETAQNGSSQVIFCDLSTPATDSTFCLYHDIKEKLIKMGIPENEIAFAHDAKSPIEKLELYNAVNDGDIRVLIASTSKGGTGANYQKKLIAVHDLDCPWLPASLEQRLGRAIRQGNENPCIKLFRYVTEESFDAYCWSIIEYKQKFISQLFNGATKARSMEEVDELVLNYAEIKAIATGNPDIRRKIELESEIGRLRSLDNTYRKEKYSLENKVFFDYPQELSQIDSLLGMLETDYTVYQNHFREPEKILVTLGDKQYPLDKADEILNNLSLLEYHGKTIGKMGNFTMAVNIEVAKKRGKEVYTHNVTFKNAKLYTTQQHKGMLYAIIYHLSKLNLDIADLQEKKDTLLANIETAKHQLEQPFEHAEALSRYVSELTEINARLDLDKQDHSIVVSDVENEEVTAEDIQDAEMELV